MGSTRRSERAGRFLPQAILAIALCLPALAGCHRASGRPISLAAPVRFLDAAARADIHFCIGNLSGEVRSPSGAADRWKAERAGQVLVVREG